MLTVGEPAIVIVPVEKPGMSLGVETIFCQVGIQEFPSRLCQAASEASPPLLSRLAHDPPR